MVYVFTENNELALYKDDRVKNDNGLTEEYKSLFVDTNNRKKIPFTALAGIRSERSDGGDILKPALRWGNQTFSSDDVVKAKKRLLKAKGWILREDVDFEEFLRLDNKRYLEGENPFCAVRGGIELVDNGDIRECAIRELKEEAGLDLNQHEKEKLIPLKFTAPRKSNSGGQSSIAIYMICLPKERIQKAWNKKNDEHSLFTNWRDCPHSGLLKYLMPDEYETEKKRKGSFETSAMTFTSIDLTNFKSTDSATLGSWEIAKTGYGVTNAFPSKEDDGTGINGKTNIEILNLLNPERAHSGTSGTSGTITHSGHKRGHERGHEGRSQTSSKHGRFEFDLPFISLRF